MKFNVFERGLEVRNDSAFYNSKKSNYRLFFFDSAGNVFYMIINHKYKKFYKRKSCMKFLFLKVYYEK